MPFIKQGGRNAMECVRCTRKLVRFYNTGILHVYVGCRIPSDITKLKQTSYVVLRDRVRHALWQKGGSMWFSECERFDAIC